MEIHFEYFDGLSKEEQVIPKSKVISKLVLHSLFDH
jgi:hypothetical protein